jgi:hypothetical protein
MAKDFHRLSFAATWGGVICSFSVSYWFIILTMVIIRRHSAKTHTKVKNYSRLSKLIPQIMPQLPSNPDNFKVQP